MNYKEELEAVGKIKFPVKAKFINKHIHVLGPVHRFKPYKDTPQDNSQLLCRYPGGKQFITFASMIYIDGKKLVNPPKAKSKWWGLGFLKRKR